MLMLFPRGKAQLIRALSESVMSNLGPSVGVYGRYIFFFFFFGLLRSEARALDRVGFFARQNFPEGSTTLC